MASPQQPRPAAPRLVTVAPRPRRKGPPRRGPSTGQRVISYELSAGLHLLVFLILWGLPHPDMPQAPKTAKKEPIPVEVAFMPQPVAPTEKKAPPGPPVKPVPEPLPRAAEHPIQPPKPAHAEAIRPRPHRPASHVEHNPMPEPAQRHPLAHRPTLAELLARRVNQGHKQEEQVAAALAARNREGSETAPDQPAAGLAHGNPFTSGSGFSGSLASRPLLSSVTPDYPPEGRQSGDEGVVRLRAYVDPSGTVTHVEIIRSSGRGYFDRAAKTALLQYRFEPLKDGDVVQHGDVEMTFRLR